MSFLISNFPSLLGISLTPTNYMPGPSPIVMVEHSVTFLSHILGFLISLLLPIPSIFFSLIFSPQSKHTFHILTLINYVSFQSCDVLDPGFFKSFFFFSFLFFCLSQYYLCHGFPKSILKQKKKKRLFHFALNFCRSCHHQKSSPET